MGREGGDGIGVGGGSYTDKSSLISGAVSCPASRSSVSNSWKHANQMTCRNQSIQYTVFRIVNHLPKTGTMSAALQLKIINGEYTLCIGSCIAL